MRYEIEYSCISHIGNIRKINQDNFICNGKYMETNAEPLSREVYGTVSTKVPVLFGVFDGMGGEECGEVASYLAAKKAAETKLNNKAVSLLTEYCKTANEAICEYTKENSISSMGTTAAMLLFSRDEITLCNIGDSKIFRISDGEITQISIDHVTVAAFGKKPPLSQNLGIPPTVLIIEPYLSQGGYKHGDKYLICSDGLTDMLSTEKILEICTDNPQKEAAKELIDQALKNGGKDNVTIILLEIKQNKNIIQKIFNV